MLRQSMQQLMGQQEFHCRRRRSVPIYLGIGHGSCSVLAYTERIDEQSIGYTRIHTFTHTWCPNFISYHCKKHNGV